MQQTLQPKVATSLAQHLRRPSLFNRATLWTLLFLAGVVWALAEAGLGRQEVVNAGGWALVARFLAASVRPELSPEFLRLTLDASLTTLAFAAGGASLSLLIGVVGGVLASEVWWESVFPKRAEGQRFGRHRAPWLAVRSALALLRGIHEIIWGLLFVNLIGLDPLAAILAISIPFGAITGKVFSEILDETPRQAYTALLNSGVSPPKALAYSLLPQAFLDWLSYGFYRFDCAIRAAAVLGMIGAGGLGFEIFVSLKALKYPQIWTLFYALFLLNGLADFWSAWVRRRLGSRISCSTDMCLELDLSQPAAPRPPGRQRDRVVAGSLLLVALLVPFSFWYVAPDAGKLGSERALANLAYLGAAFPPDFGALPPAEWLKLTRTTLAMSILATAFAGALGLLLSFPAANNFLLPGGLLDRHAERGRATLRRLGGLALLLLARGLLLVSRSIPPPIWALLILFVTFPGILPGAVALGLYTVGVLGRLMAEVTENLDERPLAALKAGGLGPGQVFTYGVLPPTVPRFIAYLLYRWEEIIRATVVIGLVGAGGLGRLLVEQLSSFDYRGVLATLIIFAALTFLVDLISNLARRAFR